MTNQILFSKCCEYLPTVCDWRPEVLKLWGTEWRSKRGTDGNQSVGYTCIIQLLDVWCQLFTQSMNQSINQSITPPCADCKMDERKQQPQIDHCLPLAAGQSESCANWEVRVLKKTALARGHHSIRRPLQQTRPSMTARSLSLPRTALKEQMGPKASYATTCLHRAAAGAEDAQRAGCFQLLWIQCCCWCVLYIQATNMKLWVAAQDCTRCSATDLQKEFKTVHLHWFRTDGQPEKRLKLGSSCHMQSSFHIWL